MKTQLKLHEALKQAHQASDIRIIGMVAEQLRAKCGMNYDNVRDFFNRHINTSAEEFEALMYESDEYQANN